MYVHGWHELSNRRRFPRLVGVVVGLSVTLTAAVVAGLMLAGQSMMSAQGAFSIAAGFAMAFTGWLTIYFAVHARRRTRCPAAAAHGGRARGAAPVPAGAAQSALSLQLPELAPASDRDPSGARGTHAGQSRRAAAVLVDSDRAETVPLVEELRIVDEYLNLERVTARRAAEHRTPRCSRGPQGSRAAHARPDARGERDQARHF